MSESSKALLRKSLIAFAAGLLMAALYVFSRDIGKLTLVEQYRVLCDAFTAPGMLMILFGLLLVMSNLGALDSLAYLGKYVLQFFLPRVFGERQNYMDYVEDKREKRTKGFGFLFLVGSVFMVVAVVFYILFCSVYE